MSVQFGKCNFDGKPIDPKDLEEVRPVLIPYAPDGEGFICKENFAVLYRAFHTTKESRREQQPCILKSGALLTWDGRLDNREELIQQLGCGLSPESTDLDVVGAAYDQWETNSFARLIGDWAMSVWNPRDRSLLLAKDFIGSRHLYYLASENQVTWCTVLDPLVLFARRSFQLEREYIAGWLASFPAPQLTPYVGISSVPPSSFVRVARERISVRKYWDFDPKKQIRYPTDAEYEEHFRAVLTQSVHRRLRSDCGVVAELSGGMDSSSIVCVADEIIKHGLADVPKVDTLSYYDNAEPNWNELPYIAAVEEKRGQTGLHIDSGSESLDCGTFGSDTIPTSPSSQRCTTKADEQFASWIAERRHRVVLSGIGGDEVAGGVPSPAPELANLIRKVQLRTLAHQLKEWAFSKRKPWPHLICEAVRPFLPFTSVGSLQHIQTAPWLRSSFAKRHRRALSGYPQRLRAFGPLPSFQARVQAVDVLRRQLAANALPLMPTHERRFPFLDRELLEFLFALPPEQLVRPGQRRSLMRRALIGIVPDEIRNRRRKGYLIRSPLIEVFSAWDAISKTNPRMISDVCGIIDTDTFAESVLQARSVSSPPIVALHRSISLELWLTDLVRHRVLSRRNEDADLTFTTVIGEPTFAF